MNYTSFKTSAPAGCPTLPPPPTHVTGVYPPANSHIAPLSATLSITFSDNIRQNSVTTQTVIVHGGMRGHTDGAITFAPIRYDPTRNFFPGELAQTSVTTGVLDSDGAPIAPFVWQFRAAASVGPATFGDSGASLGSFYSYAVALGDVDGDGDLDAFVGNYDRANKVWLNDGAGVFSDSGQSLGNFKSLDVALGDVDGDGDLDAFVGNYGQANKVWLNNGAGVFGDSGQSLSSSESFAVVLGDGDGDGDLDAFVENYGFQGLKVWLNDGGGNFRDSGGFAWGSNVAVDLGDVDGDGDLDVFAGNTQANQVWLNDGKGNFSDSGARLGSSDSFAVALGDLDGDGDLDAFVGNRNQANKVWLNDGAGNFEDSGAELGSSVSRGAALGDLDGDGDLDAFVGNYGQANKVWLNQPSEIDVQGNGQSVPNGAATPSIANHTDFGSTTVSGGAVVHTFSISSSGAADLVLTGSPNITLTNSAHFSVTAQPGSSAIASGGATAFQITFDPSAAGSFTDTVNIANNDVDENPYTFVISGAATAPTYTLTINISGNGRVDLDPPGTQGAGALNFSSVYTAGTVVTMTATADPGWRFDGWSGSLLLPNGSLVFTTSVTMDRDRTVTAAFSANNRIYLPLVLK